MQPTEPNKAAPTGATTETSPKGQLHAARQHRGGVTAPDSGSPAKSSGLVGTGGPGNPVTPIGRGSETRGTPPRNFRRLSQGSGLAGGTPGVGRSAAPGDDPLGARVPDSTLGGP